MLACILLTACASPPDVPVCEQLSQRITTDGVTGHELLTPSPTCMLQLGEAECGHCVWIVSGMERFIGEEKKQIALQTLSDTGKRDAAGKAILAWITQKDSSGKIVMVSSWLNGLKPWSTVKKQSAYLPAIESYAPLSTYIINACEKMHCSDQVDLFKVKLDSLNGVAGALQN